MLWNVNSFLMIDDNIQFWGYLTIQFKPVIDGSKLAVMPISMLIGRPNSVSLDGDMVWVNDKLYLNF